MISSWVLLIILVVSNKDIFLAFWSSLLLCQIDWVSMAGVSSFHLVGPWFLQSDWLEDTHHTVSYIPWGESRTLMTVLSLNSCSSYFLLDFFFFCMLSLIYELLKSALWNLKNLGDSIFFFFFYKQEAGDIEELVPGKSPQGPAGFHFDQHLPISPTSNPLATCIMLNEINQIKTTVYEYHVKQQVSGQRVSSSSTCRECPSTYLLLAKPTWTYLVLLLLL